MALAAARLRKFDLTVAFGIALPIRIGTRLEAMRARNADCIFRRQPILDRQRMPAGAAELRFALGQAMRDGHPLVEHKTLALPQALSGRHLFEIFQDPALEMEDIFEAERLHIGRRFLAANATGAEHRHLAAFELFTVLFHPGRELAEAGGPRVDRALERAE